MTETTLNIQNKNVSEHVQNPSNRTAHLCNSYKETEKE